MSVAHQALRKSIHREYLQEASFLYSHRRWALEDPAFSLGRIAELEARMEAHIDGLVLTGDDAVEFCLARAQEGDAGELHGAIRTFCRLDKPEAVVQAASAADVENPDCRPAIADALKYEFPPTWRPHLQAWLADEGAPPHLAAALAVTAGYRRLPVGPALLDRTQGMSGRDVIPFLRGIGQLRLASAGMVLLRFMQQDEPEVSREAAIAALRAGVPSITQHLKEWASAPWAALPLALAGLVEPTETLPHLRQALDGNSTEALVALGFWGEASGLDSLLAALEKPAGAGAAALGLYLMTGAPLPTVEDADATGGKADSTHGQDDDTAGDDHAIGRQGDEPERARLTSRHIGQSKEAWREWIQSHPLKAGVRYRLGEPYSAASVTRAVVDFRLPLAVRALVLDEMAIRFDCGEGFEPDMPALEQLRRLPGLNQALERAMAARSGSPSNNPQQRRTS